LCIEKIVGGMGGDYRIEGKGGKRR